MRKIVRYASISWDEHHWKKETVWGDPDTAQWRGAPGSSVDRGDLRLNVIQDSNVMFALHAKTDHAEMSIVTIEPDKEEPSRLKFARGTYAYVGNGFVYYDTMYEKNS